MMEPLLVASNALIDQSGKKATLRMQHSLTTVVFYLTPLWKMVHSFSDHFLSDFQASGGYNGLSNIKMEDGMTPSIPSMKVGELYVRTQLYFLNIVFFSGTE